MALATPASHSRPIPKTQEVDWGEGGTGGVQFCVVGFYYLDNSKQLKIKRKRDVENNGRVRSVEAAAKWRRLRSRI